MIENKAAREYDAVMLYTDPHTAAPALWAIRRATRRVETVRQAFRWYATERISLRALAVHPAGSRDGPLTPRR